ncbi:hypothetical protein UFOVP116_271 [uncultured Caudovirales phage]|uniref:Uncharacterized protein n=1 Tax=uncultured Caudovirales phage TaxID=2100421 RepID=A0A6J5L9Y2_9CAUD|nr:hypothetical protein UFOVP116_271 [uncultured Caudovirales phage]
MHQETFNQGTIMQVKRLPSAHHIRIVSGHVHLYTTVGKVRNGLGDSYAFNAATQKAVDALEYIRTTAQVRPLPKGISGAWENIPVQVDLIK